MDSIDGWYSNSSARQRGGFAYDPENDDPIDRTPDSWLDDHEPRRVEASRSRPARSPMQASSSGQARTQKPMDLVRALRALREKNPEIKTDTMTKRLRQDPAWAGLSKLDVEQALRQMALHKRGAVTTGRGGVAATKNSRTRASANTPPVKVKQLRREPIPRQRRASSTASTSNAAQPTKADAIKPQPSVRDSASLSVAVQVIRHLRPTLNPTQLIVLLRRSGWPALSPGRLADLPLEGPVKTITPSTDTERHRIELAVAIRAVRSVFPGIKSKKIGQKLRGIGWRQVSTEQVEQLLNPRRSKPATLGSPRIPEVAKRPHQDICGACGGPISVLGICRCS